MCEKCASETRLPSRPIVRPPGSGWRRSAIDNDCRAQRAEADRGLNSSGNRTLIHDVGAHIGRAISEFLRQSLAAFIGNVGDDNACALLRKPARSGATETAGAAGYELRRHLLDP